MIVYLAITAAAVWMFQLIPTSFLPDEDLGNFVVQVQMPENSSAQQTEVVLAAHYGSFADRRGG